MLARSSCLARAHLAMAFSVLLFAGGCDTADAPSADAGFDGGTDGDGGIAADAGGRDAGGGDAGRDDADEPLDGGSAGGVVLFGADWGTATGKSADALTDGRKMDLIGFPADLLLTSVSLSHLGVAGWPENGLQISFDEAASSSLVGFREGEGLDVGWPAPAVGESIYFRMLHYNGLPEGSGVAFSHGMQSNIGSISHGFQIFSPEGGTFTYGFFSLSGDVDSFFVRLPARTPLRIEWQLVREPGPARARVRIRIFDESVSTTTPRWTQDDFLENFGEGPESLGSLDPSIDLGDEGNGFRRYLFGTSGNSSMDTTGFIVTGFAVCDGSWCGPYHPGEG